MIRLLIAEDHKLVREGFIAQLMNAEDIVVVGEARNGLEAIELAQRLQPDVILMDIEMPRLNGFRATEQLAALGQPARVLMTSMLDDERNVQAAAECGAAGYYAKGSPAEELQAAIRAVYRGEVYSPRSFTVSMVHARD